MGLRSEVRWSVPLVLLALAGGCGRPAEEAWVVPEVPGSSLAEGLTATVPESGRLELRRAPTHDVTRTYAVALEHDVKLRGRGQSPLAISLREEFDVQETETVIAGAGATVAWSVGSSDVTVDPAGVETGPAIEDDLDGVTLKRPVSGSGVTAGEPVGGSAREVSDAMDRLLATLPDRLVAPGETWEFRKASLRSLEGGTPARVERTGTIHFEGMVTEGERDLALLEAEWDIRMSGEGLLAGRKGRVIEGTGSGRASYLVEPLTGVTVRAEAAEATHLRLEVDNGGKPQVLEQTSVLSSDLRLEDEDE